MFVGSDRRPLKRNEIYFYKQSQKVNVYYLETEIVRFPWVRSDVFLVTY